MIIQCFRCHKEINTPDGSNADYVIAEDMMVKEARAILIALKHNEQTLAKEQQIKELEAKGEPIPPELQIDDSEYDRVEIPNIEASEAIEGLVKVIVEVKEKDIQKTGVICPECYRPADFVIWGVHKGD